MFLVIPMLWAIYTAKELSTFANYTSAGSATFRLNATAGSLISLVLVNLLILILPWHWPSIHTHGSSAICAIALELSALLMRPDRGNPRQRWTEL